MAFVTILTSTTTHDEQTCLSCAGPVDANTAAAEEVVLWTDADSIAAVEAAVAADRQRASWGSRVA